MKKNLVVVGFGGMGDWHVRMARKSDVVRLWGIYDTAPEKSVLARERGIFAYDSLESVLADNAVDIVTVATPNDSHLDITVRALRAGKNVICEKPAAQSFAELKQMIDTANECRRLFSVHQNRRWDAEYLMMKQVYNGGKLGDIFTLQSIVHGSHGIPGDWRGKRRHGGGMMLDWGVHLIDQILCIVGDLKLDKIYCRCDHITNHEVDDGFKLDMYFVNGLCARVEVGTSHFIALPRFYMAGENGSAIIPDWNENCRVTYCTDRDPGNVVPVVTAAGLTKTMAPRSRDSVESFEIVKPCPDVHDYYRNFVRTMDRADTLIVTHHQIMRVMRIMEAAFESDHMGQVVKFTE